MKINTSTTKMATPIEEIINQNLKVRTGMVLVSDGKSKPELVRLHLSMEVLSLQKLDTSVPQQQQIPTSVTSNLSVNNQAPVESKVSHYKLQWGFFLYL
jgi:hypothetical protein